MFAKPIQLNSTLSRKPAIDCLFKPTSEQPFLGVRSFFERLKRPFNQIFQFGLFECWSISLPSGGFTAESASIDLWTALMTSASHWSNLYALILVELFNFPQFYQFDLNRFKLSAQSLVPQPLAVQHVKKLVK